MKPEGRPGVLRIGACTSEISQGRDEVCLVWSFARGLQVEARVGALIKGERARTYCAYCGEAVWAGQRVGSHLDMRQ